MIPTLKRCLLRRASIHAVAPRCIEAFPIEGPIIILSISFAIKQATYHPSTHLPKGFRLLQNLTSRAQEVWQRIFYYTAPEPLH